MKRLNIHMQKKQLLLLGLILFLCLALLYPLANSLNQKVMPPLGEISCVSYTPFKGKEAPWQLDQGLVIPKERFVEDLKVLSSATHCIRTYSVTGLEELFPVAREMGFRVWFGIWISGDAKANEKELQLAQKIIAEYADVIHVVIVGNEVLLRHEQTDEKLVGYIERVRAFAKGLPITYADVWEFWQKNPQVAKVVDVVTIHILPYWENDPIPVELTPAHIEKIHLGVAEQFYTKKIAIGEIGWPSRGRWREGAVASASAQYQFVQGSLELCQRYKWDCNIIEAFDQPWKRNAEGGVGGAWGLWDEFRDSKLTKILTVPQNQLSAMFVGGFLFLALGFVGLWRMAKSTNWRNHLFALLLSMGVGIVQGYAFSDYVFFTRSVQEVLWHSVLWCLPLSFFGMFFVREKFLQKFFKPTVFAHYFVLLIVLMELVFDGRYRFFPIASLGASLCLMMLLPMVRQKLFDDAASQRDSLQVNPLLGDLLLVLVTLLLNFEKLINLQAVAFGVITVMSLYHLPKRQNFKFNFWAALLGFIAVATVYSLRVFWLHSETLGGFCTANPKIWHCQIRSATGYMMYWRIWGMLAYALTALALWQSKNRVFFWVALFFALLASAFYNVDAGVVTLAALFIAKFFQRTEPDSRA